MIRSVTNLLLSRCLSVADIMQILRRSYAKPLPTQFNCKEYIFSKQKKALRYKTNALARRVVLSRFLAHFICPSAKPLAAGMHWFARSHPAVTKSRMAPGFVQWMQRVMCGGPPPTLTETNDDNQQRRNRLAETRQLNDALRNLQQKAQQQAAAKDQRARQQAAAEDQRTRQQAAAKDRRARQQAAAEDQRALRRAAEDQRARQQAAAKDRRARRRAAEDQRALRRATEQKRVARIMHLRRECVRGCRAIHDGAPNVSSTLGAAYIGAEVCRPVM